jgi:amidase
MTAFSEYHRFDALGLADLVRRREVHPRELVEAAIQRLERDNPRLNAVILELSDRARQQAEAPLPEGPFAGVPYLLKDMVLHAGTRVTFGNALFRALDYAPDHSHPVVERLEAAGLILVGKTNACEFGLLPITEPEAYGATANPWALDRSPGGSSGGAAAAVAGGLVPLAHGNDGGGSLRIPASACGVFALKPSRGRNPGSAEDCPDGIVCEGAISRTVRDSAAHLDVTRGPRPGDRWWAPPPDRPYREAVDRDPPRLRIAFSTVDLQGRRAHPDCVAAVEDAARLCESLGHPVEEARPAVDGTRFDAAFAATWTSLARFFYEVILREARKEKAVDLAVRALGPEAVLAVLPRLATRRLRAPFERATRLVAERAAAVTHARYYLAAEEVQRAAHVMGGFLETFDLWLTPTLAEPPLRTGALTGLAAEALGERMLRYAAYTPICNAVGLPAMSVPLCWNAAGLPIGVHFVGRFGDEATLLRLAGQLERARPWFDRRPPGFP